MRVFILYIFTLLIICCSSKESPPKCKEFTHYPNIEKISKNENFRFLHKYYFIENAPENDIELQLLTDKYSDSLMTYKLNERLNSVVLMFFTDKESIWTSINENYSSDGPTVEDYYNPRRAEYAYRLDSKKNIYLERIIYENKTKIIIPPISFIDKKKVLKTE